MILIVYYSGEGGHTEKVATALAEKVGGGRLARIEPVTEAGGMFRKGMMAMFGMRAEVRPVKTDLADVDFLVVATPPVWSRKVPPYVNEYLSKVTAPRENPSRCSWRWAVPGRRAPSRS